MPRTSTFHEALADASFPGQLGDRHSTSGIVDTCNVAPIFFQSKRHEIMAMSTAYEDYIAIAASIQNITAIQLLWTDTGPMTSQPISLKTYNEYAMAMLYKRYGTKRRKFFDLRHAFIQDHLSNNSIRIWNATAAYQKADLYTKPLQ